MKVEIAISLLDLAIKLLILILCKYLMASVKEGRMKKFAETVVWAMEQLHNKPGQGKLKKEEATTLMEKKFKPKKSDDKEEISIVIEDQVRKLKLVEEQVKSIKIIEEVIK